MGNCVEIKECLACGGKKLVLVLDLKNQPLANSYKKNVDDVEEYFPLAINRCDSCFHIQLSHQVDPDLLFRDYLYVSGTSKTHLEYFEWFTDYVLENHPLNPPKSVLDIGCNDGSQLNAFKERGVETFGVDPANNLHQLSSKNHSVICGYFNDTSYPAGTSFDVITCQNAFAHNYNPLQFLENVSKVMGNYSVLYITTSQANMILNNEFDTIYHEHLSFYNIKSMEKLCKRAGLNLIDVIKHPIHGTSYIFVISKFFKRPSNIHNLISLEYEDGLYDVLTYQSYVDKCNNIIHGFKRVVDSFKKRGILVVGYGAAAKGNTLLNASGAKLDFIIDDNPMKQGLFTPGLSIPIYSIDFLDDFSDVDKICFVPLAWNFFDEIKSKIVMKRGEREDSFVRYFPSIEIESNEPLFHHPV